MNSKFVNRNLVIYESQSWLDVMGPNAVKFADEFVAPRWSVVAADASGVLSDGWINTLTEVGAPTTVAALGADCPGGWINIQTGSAASDGLNAQQSNESFTFTSAYPTYFGIRFQLLAEANLVDFIAGLCITDTTLVGGMSEGVYFRKPTGGTALSLVLEEATVETVTTYTPAIAAATWYTAEFVYQGGSMRWWVNGVRQTNPVLTNLPNAAGVNLTPSIAFLTQEANLNNLYIDWIRCFQIQAV